MCVHVCVCTLKKHMASREKRHDNEQNDIWKIACVLSVCEAGFCLKLRERESKREVEREAHTAKY